MNRIELKVFGSRRVILGRRSFGVLAYPLFLFGINVMKRSIISASCISLLLATGCDTQGLVESKPAEPTATAPAAAAPAVNAPAVGGEVASSGAAGEGQKAGVGVGIRGDSLRNEEGVGKMIAAPAVALFNAREKVVFEIQIPHALNLFKALEGRVPKTHEEFMQKIVQANGIQLPELKPGTRYRFRPDQGDAGELWVEPIE